MKCQKCNAEMIYIKENHSCGFTCPNCEWEIITTYHSPIELDINVYTLKINACLCPTTNMLRCISKIILCNFIEARKRIKEGSISISESAIIINEIRAKLDKENICYTISPYFPYDINGNFINEINTRYE